MLTVPIWTSLESLATRIFILLDENQDNQINLLQFLFAAVIMLKADADCRLKFFYLIHLLENPELDAEESPDDMEEATEATEFFQGSPPSSYSFCSTENIQENTAKTFIPQLLASIGSKYATLESSMRLNPPSPRHSPCISKCEPGHLPKMYQNSFIRMWKTLYDLFAETEQKQQMYHSVACVGTELLRLGEVALQHKEDTKKNQTKVDEGENSCSSNSESFEEVDRPADSFSWSITFEQFKATLYIEQPLVEFFETKVEVTQLLEKLRDRKNGRAMSIAPGTNNTA